MTKIMIFIFRILLFGLGLFVTYSFGRDTVEPIWHSLTGTRVEGRISGFLAGRNSPSVQRDPDGVRKGKNRARRPVFTFPTSAGGLDSLEARSSSSTFFAFSNYKMNERVTVVFANNEPAHAHILGFQLIATSFILTLLGLYMIRLGALWRE
jgi:hypothetical protein